ncbi:MAG TPA: ABC transporter ATP-binding protein [Bacteroidota bacterium]|nr:ABC transporter ATP-binding protein [Bacteroidota bacterium]
MISLNHLTKKFGSFTAVDNLSIEIHRGELYGFLGPNGAGKTTTIKMMTGLFTPTTGSITLAGFDTARQPMESKLITGYIPDQPFIYERLTGKEFLHFSAGLHKMKHAEAAKRVAEVVERLEIGSWMDRRVEDYSQGMKQRTAIAAALLHRPAVLVVDEPMVGLDPRSAHLVKQLFRETADNGTSVFMSTHSLAVAEEVCDRIGIIKDGRLVFEDTIVQLQTFKHKYDGKFESVFLELTK